MLSTAKIVLMRRTLVCVGLSLALAVTACSTPHMISTDSKPTLAIKKNKAVLVIIRPKSASYSQFVIDNYLDGRMIGQTCGFSYFVVEVDPGMHYLTANAQNRHTAYLNFVAGRIYFLQQGIFPGGQAPTTRYIPLTFTEAKMQINEPKVVYLVNNTSNPAADMLAKDFDEEVKRYEKEVKENHNSHKSIREYHGYDRM